MVSVPDENDQVAAFNRWEAEHPRADTLSAWMAACEWQHVQTVVATLHPKQLRVLRLVGEGKDTDRAIDAEQKGSTAGWVRHNLGELERLGLVSKSIADDIPGVKWVWALTETGRQACG